ncbi:hypothetical protein F503_03362 [Ophiostoma piceae UAMH 11346]|uniref:Uncharacterized protein n=1 Tax=Ophiostoma piceae (strain UAMH 11346) TaxID=1262450 RepID=S3D0Z3_OPHP1|nr:hypothetical protein F503_03362 [Ophiostoma piceae UAMH 11346]
MCCDNTATPCDEAIKSAFEIAATHPLIGGKFGRIQLDRQGRDPEDPPSWRAWWTEVRTYLSHLKYPPTNNAEVLTDEVMHDWRQRCGTTGVPLPPKNETARYVYSEFANPVALHRRPASLDSDPRYKRMLSTPVGCFEITTEDIEAFGDDKKEIARYVQFAKARHRVRLAISVAKSWTRARAAISTDATNTEESHLQEGARQPSPVPSLVAESVLLPEPGNAASENAVQSLAVSPRPGSV